MLNCLSGETFQMWKFICAGGGSHSVRVPRPPLVFLACRKRGRTKNKYSIFSSFPMSDAEPTKSSEPKNTGFTPGDDTSTKWRNTFNLLLGRMTDEGMVQFKKDRDDRNEKEDCERCEKHRDYLLKYSA